MKSTRLFVLAAVALGATAALLGRLDAQEADSAPSARTAVCDVNEVFLSYRRAGDLTAQLDAERQELNAEAKARSEAIEALQSELGALKEGSEGFDAKVDQIETKIMEGKVWEEMSKMRLVRRHHELTKEMYEEILAAVAAVAAEQGYSLVLTADEIDLASMSTEQLLAKIAQRKVLHNDPAIDITDAVVNWLNERYATPTP